MMSMMRSEQMVNMGMKSVIALVVMMFCGSIPSAFAEVLQNTRYSYDTIGNIEALTDPLNGHQQFAYDDLDRLQTANGPYGNYTYQYDAIGNLTVNPQVSPNPYAYPASGPSSVRPHAVTTAGANTYTYDNNGNMLTGAGRTYTWNQENKPLTIVQGGVTTTVVYDGDGGRVKKIVGTTTTRYISKLYECDTNGGTTSCSRFIWAGDQRIATVADNGTVHYWHVDHLGSSSVITNGTGARVETITYYPYGEVRTDTPGTPVNVPYKYTGQERDGSTGLYYYEARYYDPTLARFISADTIIPSMLDPQALNRYTYAMNNPMYYTDPSGHCAIFCVFFIGFAIGAISSGIQSGWDLEATLVGGAIGGVSSVVGFNTFGAASAAFSGLGKIGAGIAGGIVAGAVAGGTSGILANMAGYNVNVGLAIASGAAAGGIVGGAGVQFGGWGAFAAAPAAGAAGAAISGADPGMGAAISAASAAFAMGVQYAYEQAVLQTQILPKVAAAKGQASLAVDVQASDGDQPILMAQRIVREGRGGAALDATKDLLSDSIEFFGDMRDLRMSGQVKTETEFLGSQIPRGEARRGHIFIDKFTGEVKSSDFERHHLWNPDTTIHQQKRILGPSGPPQLRQGR